MKFIDFFACTNGDCGCCTPKEKYKEGMVNWLNKEIEQ